jgi:hypothetical protein
MSEYLDATIAWALSALRGKAPAAPKKAARVPEPMRPLVETFALDAVERRLVELAWAVERSSAVAAAAGRPFTVEAARAALGDASVDARLQPGARLRRLGLVRVDDGWLGGVDAPVRLAPGLARRLDGEPVAPELLGPGTRRLSAAANDRVAPQPRLEQVVSDHLRGAARLLTLEGCPRRDALALAALAARGLGRGVLVLDGEALARLDGAWWLVAAARREADLDGDVLVIVQAAALGEAWRAAAGAAAAQPRATTFVVLADAERPREVVLDEGLPHQAVALADVKAGVAAKPKEDDGFDYVRQQAVRDAERALGIVRRDGPRPAIPPPAQRTASGAPPAHTAAATPTPATAASAATTPATAATKPATAAAPAAAAGAPPRRRSRKALEHFGNPDGADLADRTAPPEAAAPAEPAATTAPRAPSAAPTAPTAAAAAAASAADAPGSNAPYVDVPADAAPDAIARIANTCANPNQRIELLQKISAYRSPNVVATLRGHLRSEHPGVRAAAEAGMAALFGPDWNRARAIGKPVQPPRSDDNDRGPPGGF